MMNVFQHKWLLFVVASAVTIFGFFWNATYVTRAELDARHHATSSEISGIKAHIQFLPTSKELAVFGERLARLEANQMRIIELLNKKGVQ